MPKPKTKKNDSDDPNPKFSPSYIATKEVISYVSEKGFKVLGKLLDALLKKNPYKIGSRKYIMWNEQAGINIPLLYLGSIRVFEYANSLKIKHLLFVTRDCCHWHRIFTALFGEEGFKVTYFNSSRIMFQEASEKKNKYYMDYFDKATGGDITKSMYIDIHGTGKNMQTFAQKQYQALPACFLLTVGAKTYKDMPKECYELYKKGQLLGCTFDKKGSPAEMLNYDTIGTLINYDKNGPVRMPPEYDIRLLKPYKKCVDIF